MANWWEEEDKYGYTYADKNRPGYMGQPIVKEKEDVEVTEDDKKFVKDVEEDNWESFQPEIRRAAELEERKEIGPDFTMEFPFELTEEQKKLSKRLDDEKLPDIGLPQGEPKILKEVDGVGEKKVKSLFKKAMSAKGKKRADGYANVWKALQAYKGKDTPFLKGLKNRFSKKASATNNKQHLGDYKDYFDQGYSWQVRRQAAPRVSTPPVPQASRPAVSQSAPQPQTFSQVDEFESEIGQRGQRAKSLFKAEVQDGHSLDFDFDLDADTDNLREDYSIMDLSSVKDRETGTVSQLSDSMSFSSSNIIDSDRNKENLRDGYYIPGRGARPKLNVLGIPFVVSENHLAEGRGHGPKLGNYTGWQKKVYPNGHGFALKKNEMGEDELVKLQDGKKWNIGLDMYSGSGIPRKYQNKIVSFAPGTVVQIDDELTAADKDELRRAGMRGYTGAEAQLRRRKYPSMWGRRMIVRSNDVREFDGRQHQIYFQYGHGAKTAFNNLKVGDSIKLKDVLGDMGTTNQDGAGGVPKHIDVHAFILVRDKDGKSKKVFLSPTEWLPKGTEARDEGERQSEQRTQEFDNGGEVEYKDSWREEEETVEEIPEYLQRPEDREEKPFIPGVPEVKGFAPQQEPVVDSYDPEMDEQRSNMRRAEAEEMERQRLEQRPNLIEESKKTVEEFQRPDAEMIRKSHAEIQANLDDVDPKTGILSPEATQYLAQIPRQTLLDYRETYGSSGDRSKINDVIVQQESIIEEIDKADSLQLGKGEKKPIPPSRVSELDFLKIQRYKDERELRRAETESINQAMKQSAIDPERFYKNQSTFDKVVSLIGLAAGAYGAHKYGGPNVYIAELDKEVAKDIRAQKLDQDLEKRKFAAHNFKVATLAKRLARSAKNVTTQQNLIKIAQTAELKGMKIIKKQEIEKKKMLDIATLNKRGITDNELAYLMSKYPKLKIQESLITARDGKHYYIKGGRQAVKLMKTTLADTQDSIDGLRDLEGYVEKVKIWEQGWSPWAFFSTDRAEAGALRDRLVGKLRIEFFGPGVMTDNEREQAKKILGDPNAFWTTDAKEKAKIRTLIMKLNYGMRQKLRRDGLTMLPLSPNERRVEQLLKKNKLNDNPNNRVKIVNSLIEAEKEAVTQGQPAGKLWDMNEPLPI